MDWLMYIMMIILFAAVLVLLWKNYRIKKEAKLFAEKVEDALDAIVTGKEWNMEVVWATERRSVVTIQR